tara:strand:- start:216 stop:485 length:270 start_codon:yes stop_codon:yes gene_type:complete
MNTTAFKALMKTDLSPAVQRYLLGFESSVLLGRIGKLFLDLEEKRKRRQQHLPAEEEAMGDLEICTLTSKPTSRAQAMPVSPINVNFVL